VSAEKYLENFVTGQRIRSGEFVATAELMRSFAQTYDPQPMHLDEEAAKASMFGCLIGSGWQTLAITMRLLVDARLLGSTPIVGAALKDVRFHKPMRPGDVLTAEAEVLGTRISRSNSGRGFLDLLVITSNQFGEKLITQNWTLSVPSNRRALTTR
jgi:acyl dehydratase